MMEVKPTRDEEATARRLALLDELDILVSENKARRPVMIVMGLFTLSLIFAVEEGSIAWALFAVALFALFLGFMAKPIKRFGRIHELRRELQSGESEAEKWRAN